MKLNQIAFALVATLGVIGAAHADVAYGQSYGGETDDGLLRLSGVAYDGSGTTSAGVDGELLNLNASFENHLAPYATIDGNDVYHFAGSELAWIPFDHTGLGVWDFKQVGDADVWFGNWATEVGTTGAADSSTYTVFYTGQDADTAISSANYGVQANYSVSGLNNGDYYSGTYVANFGADGNTAGTLTGSLTDGTSTFTLSNTAINTDATISGTGAWTGGKIVSGGDVSGQFFNTQAQLAGIATFTDRQYDISFGGVRQ
ncbi:Slam-dependent surface lipoprotein [Acinetobacter puyangensis]|uniref:Slam-dependent surface lipoprotein n=1 Tax=Acinetobacter puyangensis TaxID=1096779 RepID=UPI003A4D44D3